MKRERQAAARLAGWRAVQQQVEHIQEMTLPDFTARGMVAREEVEAALDSYNSFLSRLANWLEVNKPKGSGE